MGWFHRCSWKVLTATAAVPTVKGFKVKGTSSEAMLKLVYGFTTVLVDCRICGKLRIFELVGQPAGDLGHFELERLERMWRASAEEGRG